MATFFCIVTMRDFDDENYNYKMASLAPRNCEIYACYMSSRPIFNKYIIEYIAIAWSVVILLVDVLYNEYSKIPID